MTVWAKRGSRISGVATRSWPARPPGFGLAAGPPPRPAQAPAPAHGRGAAAPPPPPVGAGPLARGAFPAEPSARASSPRGAPRDARPAGASLHAKEVVHAQKGVPRHPGGGGNRIGRPPIPRARRGTGPPQDRVLRAHHGHLLPDRPGHDRPL